MPNELILIIEDNAINRTLVRDVLRFKGYQTLESETGEDGMQTKPIHVVEFLNTVEQALTSSVKRT